jgi:hypothetical protein
MPRMKTRPVELHCEVPTRLPFKSAGFAMPASVRT